MRSQDPLLLNDSKERAFVSGLAKLLIILGDSHPYIPINSSQTVVFNYRRLRRTFTRSYCKCVGLHFNISDNRLNVSSIVCISLANQVKLLWWKWYLRFRAKKKVLQLVAWLSHSSIPYLEFWTFQRSWFVLQDDHCFYQFQLGSRNFLLFVWRLDRIRWQYQRRAITSSVLERAKEGDLLQYFPQEYQKIVLWNQKWHDGA